MIIRFIMLTLILSIIPNILYIYVCIYTFAHEHTNIRFLLVFIGEIKGNGEVTGLHNWLQIYAEEKAGRLDYKGFIAPRKRGAPGPHENEQMVTMNFTWRGAEKKVSTSLIGTSPEFEMALYTLAFYNFHEGEVATTLGPYHVLIKTHFWQDKRSGKTYIATSYPEVCEENQKNVPRGGGKGRPLRR